MDDGAADGELVRAQERAGVTVRTLVDLSDLDDARDLFDLVWPAEGTQVQANLMKAVVHAGGYAAAAYRDGAPVGAAFGFLGRSQESGGWHEHLHSHMAAVLPSVRDQHVGSALKMHQRAWALDRGIDTIVWTFDPLVRRNAIVNLLKLGVDVGGFEPDFYGSMADAINADDPTDRLFAWWRLGSERARAAARGELVRLDIATARAQGRDVIALAIPADIVALRSGDAASARRWRHAMREGLEQAFAAGYRIIGITVEDGYALERQR